MNVVREWINRTLSDPQVVTLGLILIGGLLLIMFFGGSLAPIFAAIIIAYFLEVPVRMLMRLRMSRGIAAGLLSMALLVGVLLVSLSLTPLLTRQAAQIFQELPSIIATIQAWLLNLPDKYPALITTEQIEDLLTSTTQGIGFFRQEVLSRSVGVGVSLLYLAVYIILVPLMVFFFLRDKTKIVNWLKSFVPTNQGLAQSVWREVDRQLANYVRGKVVEILVVWLASYITFTLLGLKYAVLLSALVGLSVLVPYLGALAMTVPVALVAYSQWGFEAQTVYVLIAYGILQALDGNVLVPILFSEAVNLHPIAIIGAVLFFGGVWGFWGVFFAIPLATVVHAVINAWPSASTRREAEQLPPEPSDSPAV
ncbi:MAG: AI-2E family transporter [Salinisphaeraceae bacterium]|nr:AI-2E family transporter [Salinisphaeraceae bacterium]